MSIQARLSGSPVLSAQFSAMPRTDYNQTDPTKADYLVGRENIAPNAELASARERIASLEGEITNLEKAIAHEPFATDNSIAYTKVVPENSLPSVAEVSMLGGMSRKCTNLFDKTAIVGGKGLGSGGPPYTDANYCYSDAIAVKEGEVYSTSKVRWCNFYTDNNTPSATNFVSQNSATTFTVPSGAKYVRLSVLLSDADVAVINEGSTALPYEPYFGGLASAKVTEVESVGVNVFDPAKFVEAGWAEQGGVYSGSAYAFYKTFYGKNMASAPFEKGKRYIIGFEGKNELADNYTSLMFGFAYTDGTEAGFGVNGNTFTAKTLVSKAGKDVSHVYATYSTNGKTYVRNMFISEYTGDNEYIPYTSNTLPIPEAVQAIDGYGDGVNESVYNYIDFEKKQFVKRVGKVDMGTLGWGYYSPGFFSIDRQKNITNIATGNNLICDCYKTISPRLDPEMAGAPDLSICSHAAGVWLSVKDTKYGNDVNAFTSGVSGSMLYYELATPEVIDISDILPNSIEVEGGGTLTFKNEHKLAMPSEVDYYAQVKGVSLTEANKREIAVMVASLLGGA